MVDLLFLVLSYQDQNIYVLDYFQKSLLCSFEKTHWLEGCVFDLLVLRTSPLALLLKIRNFFFLIQNIG